MKVTVTIGRHTYTITTEHSASSYGLPVCLRDGELTDIRAEYEGDEPVMPSVLDLLADAAGVWGGAQTRRKLAEYAQAHLPEHPTGADYDRVIAAWTAEGERMRFAELTEGAAE